MPNKELIKEQIDDKHEMVPEGARISEKRAHISSKARPYSLFSTLQYYSIFMLYAVVYYCVRYLHNSWLSVFVIYSVLPICDKLVSEDWLNPTKQQERDLTDNVFFKVPLYLDIIVDWAYFFWVIDYLNNQPFDLLFWTGVLIASATLISTNFMVAHELIHKLGKISRLCGCLTITKMLYTHFFIEHQYGHHRNVATPNDPATSRLGEGLYTFLPRSIYYSWISSWNIEKRRLVEVHEYPTHWSINNRMIWFNIGYILFPTFIYLHFGFIGLCVSLINAAGSVLILEAINYVEHYGLQRKEISPGEYEKVNITHSWNAPHRITNYVLFKLQRHSDHHENSYKPYQTLATYDESPMLPNGYAFCLLMTVAPFFWHKTIDPLVLAYRKGTKLTDTEKASSERWMNLYLITTITILAGLSLLNAFFSNTR